MIDFNMSYSEPTVTIENFSTKKDLQVFKRVKENLTMIFIKGQEPKEDFDRYYIKERRV